MSNFLLVEAQGDKLLSFILPPSEATGNTTLRYEHGSAYDGGLRDVLRRARFHSLPLVLGRGLSAGHQHALSVGAARERIVVLNDW